MDIEMNKEGSVASLSPENDFNESQVLVSKFLRRYSSFGPSFIQRQGGGGGDQEGGDVVMNNDESRQFADFLRSLNASSFLEDAVMKSQEEDSSSCSLLSSDGIVEESQLADFFRSMNASFFQHGGEEVARNSDSSSGNTSCISLLPINEGEVSNSKLGEFLCLLGSSYLRGLECSRRGSDIQMAADDVVSCEKEEKEDTYTDPHTMVAVNEKQVLEFFRKHKEEMKFELAKRNEALKRSKSKSNCTK